jgi:hypothetical protein
LFKRCGHLVAPGLALHRLCCACNLGCCCGAVLSGGRQAGPGGGCLPGSGACTQAVIRWRGATASPGAGAGEMGSRSLWCHVPPPELNPVGRSYQPVWAVNGEPHRL